MPDAFRVGEYTASFIADAITAEQLPDLEIAARDCPVAAITVIRENGVLADNRVNADDDLSAGPSGDAPRDDHEEGEDVKERGEIAEYKRKHRDAGDADEIEANDAERLERGKHHLSIVRNGTDDD